MQKLGAQQAKNILQQKQMPKRAIIVALYGNLGAGKTIFAQGFGRGLGITKRIQSPTFVVMRRYALSQKNGTWFYHLDLYRMKDEKDAEHLALEEIFKDQSAVVLIEWADRISKMLPRSAIKIKFVHGKKKNERIVQISN